MGFKFFYMSIIDLILPLPEQLVQGKINIHRKIETKIKENEYAGEDRFRKTEGRRPHRRKAKVERVTKLYTIIGRGEEHHPRSRSGKKHTFPKTVSGKSKNNKETIQIWTLSPRVKKARHIIAKKEKKKEAVEK